MEGTGGVGASVTELGDIILQPAYLVFISMCTYLHECKTIIFAIDRVFFIEVSHRRLGPVVTHLHATGIQ